MDEIHIVLVGGPERLTEGDRHHTVASLDDPVKVRWGRGYEHYRFNGNARHGLPVFQWCTRTRAAE